jgi:catechol 2,3-dioxygenase-like lactoylglutathione lyase family enzyme
LTNTLQITPCVHVRDLTAAVAFMEEVLGFRTVVRMEEHYAYLDRDRAGMRVMAYPEAHVLTCGT